MGSELSESKLNLLIAYPYFKNEILDLLKTRSDDIRLVIDSGAFTAWKAGKEITVDEYARFLDGLPIKPWRYFTLDVVGDPQRSLANYDALRGQGFSPIPIFTRGDSVEMIDRYYETSDVLGVGGLVGTKGNKGFVKGIMSRIGKRNVHWLGFANLNFIYVYRPYMCDSSRWANAVKFGSLFLYSRGGAWLTVTKNDFINRPGAEVCRLISEYGYDPSALADRQAWVNSGTGKNAVEVLTCRAWTKFMLDVGATFGTKLFLPIGTGWQARLMHDAYKFWRDK